MSSRRAPPSPGVAPQGGALARGGILVLAWAILLGLVVGIGRLLTGPLKGSVGSADTELARWFADQRTSSLNLVAESISLLGNTRTVLVLASAIAIGASVWRHTIRPALFVACATAGVAGIYILAANAVHRPRPPVKISTRAWTPRTASRQGTSGQRPHWSG